MSEAEERWENDLLSRELEAEEVEIYELSDGGSLIRVKSHPAGKWHSYRGNTVFEAVKAAYADNANRNSLTGQGGRE